MQTVDPAFTTASQAARRKLTKRALVSFEKNYQATTRFFTVGVSACGGPDPIFGTGATLQEWDKFDYDDFTSRVTDMEVTREMDMLSSMISSIADFSFSNVDQKFTPGHDPDIGEYILQGRPVKLFWGFDSTAIPAFTGLTEKVPNLSSGSQAKFHAIDFLTTISNIELDRAVLYESQRTDQVLSDLLINHAGLAASQFVLDVGMNVIPFAYFKKGDKLGSIIRELMEGELGTFFQDELGMFRFWNRQHSIGAASVWTFSKQTNVLDDDPLAVENVINTVEVNARVRQVQAKQKLWESSGPTEIKGGSTIEIFADFKDDFGDLPVTILDTPEYIGIADTSSYETNTAQDGSGDAMNAYISLTDFEQFATGCKMVFTNTHPGSLFITKINLYAKPAKVVSEIYHRESDGPSVAKYDERIYTIDNDFIQDEAFAISLARMIIQDRKLPTGVRNLKVRGVPQLQNGDIVTYDAEDGQGPLTYKVMKIAGSLDKGGLIMNVQLVRFTINKYFTVGFSAVGGTDMIAP